MACLGAKNITVWFQEGEHHEQGTHAPKGVLVPRWDLGFMPVPHLLKPCAWASGFFFMTLTLVKF